jgi:hypothetical protein
MTLINLVRPLRPASRRERSVCLAVEPMESRLVLSPTLPLPPPHAATVLASIPNGPCLPTGPCTSQVWSGFPNGPCASHVSENLPSGPCSS